MNHGKVRLEDKARSREKQARKKSRGPKQLGWRRQETVQLLIEGTNPQELHEAVDVAIKELSRPIRLRFPSPAEARAGKRIVTAIGSGPKITLELSPGLVLGDRPGRYGFGLQRQYLIDRQGKPPIIARMHKRRGRPPLDPALIDRAERLHDQGNSYSKIAIELRLVRKDESVKEAGERIRSALRRRRSHGKKSD